MLLVPQILVIGGHIPENFIRGMCIHALNGTDSSKAHGLYTCDHDEQAVATIVVEPAARLFVIGTDHTV